VVAFPLAAGAVPFPAAPVVAAAVGWMVIGIGTDTETITRLAPDKLTCMEKLVETDAWGAAVVPAEPDARV